MRRRAKVSKRRSEAYMEKNDSFEEESKNDSTVRIPHLRSGSCSKGVCGPEAACKPFENNTYTCLCPHDSAPPTADGRCPTRYTVPMKPSRIENIRPPVDNVTTVRNKTTEIHNSSNSRNSSGLPVGVLELPSSSHANDFTHQSYILVAGLATCIVLSMVVLTLILRCIRHKKNSKTPNIMVLKRSPLMADRYAPNPQYSTCPSTAVPVLQSETLQFLSEIGEGCFGKVYKGELQSGVDHVEIVAIKVLKDTASPEAEEDFLREVDIMSAFRHCNILSLLGVVLRESNISPMMVFEYMPHGDLAEVLRAQKRQRTHDEDMPALGPKELLTISLQIANGMRYLAAQRFVHRDLACRNCLVSAGPVVKIADFGMSRDVYTCDYYKIGGSRLLPVRWMSPESILYGRFTLESDIWSYGVVLWEIYSYGKQPHYGHTNEEVVKLILDSVMLVAPDDAPSYITELMQLCWKNQAKDRIRFPDIHSKLEKAYDSYQESDLSYENEKLINSLKRLPRPPISLLTPCLDLLDTQGYLMPNHQEEVAYLETLPD